MAISDQFVTSRDVGSALGCSYRNIENWAKAGKVSQASGGAYSFLDCVAYYTDYLRKQIQSHSEKSKENLDEQIKKAKLRKTELEADIIQIERDMKQKELIPLTQVVDEVNGAFVRVRTKMMGIPDRFAIQLASIQDPLECKNLLMEGVIEALEELSSEIVGTDQQDEPIDEVVE
jgi:phage terminase Nu1 subunit (DNA packaging protein)